MAVLLHWVSQFPLKSMGTLARFLVVFGAITGVLIILQIALKLPLEDTLSAIVWFVFLCELYVFLFTLSLSSISVKILQLLRHRPMTFVEIETTYRPDAMVNKRFERLQTAGLIEGQNNFTLTAKGRKLMFLLNFVKNILHCNRKQAW